MDGRPLDASPLAALLLDLAARRATGRLAFGGRAVLLRRGELLDVLPAADDAPLARYLVEGGRISADGLERFRARAERERTSLLDLLQQEGAIAADILEEARRDVLLDRLLRGLQSSERHDEPLPVLEPAPEAGDASAAPQDLVGAVLSTLTREAQGSATDALSSALNHRLTLRAGEHQERARAFCNLEPAPERPAVATILARDPSAAARVMALLRAGLATLSPPGHSHPSEQRGGGTLPPAPMRSSAFPTGVTSAPPPGDDPLAGLSERPPRTRLDPGLADASTEPLSPTPLPRLPEPTLALDDPMRPLEQNLQALEARGAPGPERARVLRAMAEIWRTRFGSVERSCRWLREAVAADPDDARLLEQTALCCHHMGDPELAARYAEAAVAMAGISIERASAQRLRATVLRASGDADGAVEALCEAAADDPTSPEPHELVAGVLLARGNAEGTNAHARLAAAAHQDADPERARALLDWAWSLQPTNVPTTVEYASLLDMTGRRTGAVAVLAETAARSTDPDGRRKLRLAAAQRAEAAERPDMAAELLREAFDVEPHFDLLYAPLEEDLRDAVEPALHAAVIEDIASACPDGQRAHWLTRAAHAMARVEAGHEAAAWLFYEAMLTDPMQAQALDGLRAHARSRRELLLLAHALRTHIAAGLGGGLDMSSELRTLGEIAEEQLHNPDLALAAFTQLRRLGGGDEAIDARADRLAETCEERRERLAEAESALRAATPEQRAGRAVEVAGLLPDLPEEWPRTVSLLRDAHRAERLRGRDRERLETLLGLSRDAEALLDHLESESEHAGALDERLRLLHRIAAVHTVRGDARKTAITAERILAQAPGDALGLARLERAGRRLRDPDRIGRVLALRADAEKQPARRARTLARLARLQESLHEEGEAAKHAAQALSLDATAADAALVLLRTAHMLPAGQALPAVRRAADALGVSRRLCRVWSTAATTAGDRAATQEALERWVRVLPMDVEARAALIRAQAPTADPDPLVERCVEALGVANAEEVLMAVREAIAALTRRGAHLQAARLSLELAEQAGLPDESFSRRALQAARLAHDSLLTTRALERLATSLDGRDRVGVLLELSAHHRDHGDHAAEARVLLRVLELDGAHPVALRQLETIFRAAGDAVRLHAVSTLALEAEEDPEARRRRLLELAGLAFGPLGDREQAELHLRALIAESATDAQWMRRAAGLLLSMGDLPWALERCVDLADECPPELGARLYLWAAVTAENRLTDDDLALRLALRGTRRFPMQAELLLIVERITLQRDGVDTAMDTYDWLIDSSVGPHGRRALLYRAGRWLERTGRLGGALSRYRQAFELGPSGGVAFKALERVACELGDHDALCDCYETLARHVDDDSARVALLREAAGLCQTQSGRHERALSLLLEANAATAGHTLDGEVLEAARLLARANPEAGRAGWNRVRQALEARVELLWDGPDKAATLVRLAEIFGNELDDHPHALGCLERAEALAVREELEPDVRTDIAVARAEELLRTGRRAEARRAMADALQQTPDHPGALRMNERLAADREVDSSQVAPPPAVSTPEAGRRVTLELARQLLGERTGTVRARELLRDLCIREPGNVEALHTLYEATAASGSGAEYWVAATLMSVFDPSVEAPPAPAFHAALWRDHDLLGAIGEPFDPEVSRFLERLWECARAVPRYRGSLRAHGISERDRISRQTVGPVAEAYGQAARALRIQDVPVFLGLQPDPLVRVLPTHPPSLVAARLGAPSESVLMHEIARGLWLAQPRFAVTGAVTAEESRTLLDAAVATFGGSAIAKLGEDARDVAAALYQAVPAIEQRGLGKVVLAHRNVLRSETVRSRVMRSAARAALLVSGALREAIGLVATREPELADLDVSRSADFKTGCERSSELAEIVRCALEEPFLGALDRALHARQR
ncbi:MAG: hypothetical protein PVI30_00225 [Myxococcales bacterium]|jgi:tetratricopeptide (TPR) repeat protein